MITRDTIREMVFECSIAYANALLRGTSIQEAELIRMQKFNEYLPEPSNGCRNCKALLIEECSCDREL